MFNSKINSSFVANIVHDDELPDLLQSLDSLSFICHIIKLEESSTIGDLFGCLHASFGLDEYSPSVPTSWDGLSDIMWQKIMFSGMTKMAVAIECPINSIVKNIGMLFELSEIFILLEQAVCDAREADKGIPLRLRIFITLV